jgi:hypothetical protein
VNEYLYTEAPFSRNTVRALLVIIWLVALSPLVMVGASIAMYHFGMTKELPVVYTFTPSTFLVLGYFALLFLHIIYIISLKLREESNEAELDELHELNKDLF